ncbi:MAG: sporulation protein, partial [Clostridiales bacterium]|nr:sporulation protein [Clostridiales bacterium]
GNLLLTASGQSEIYVENYRSIIEYTSSLIKLQGKNCKVSISGKALFIEYYTSDEMKIIGRIGEIKYYS